MSIRAVIFDWGGTLTPWHDLDLYDLWRDAAAILAPDQTDAIVEALVRTESELWQRSSTTLQSATIREVLSAVQTELELDLDEALHDKALEAHLESMTPHTITDEQAAPMLRELHAAGLRTGLLSNTHWPREWHERFLERDGVIDLLDARVYTSELERVKPHREAFAAVLNELNIEPIDAVFVGDRPIDDIKGAHDAGLRTIWIPNGRLTELAVEPEARVTSLSEIPTVVKQWSD